MLLILCWFIVLWLVSGILSVIFFITNANGSKSGILMELLVVYTSIVFLAPLVPFIKLYDFIKSKPQ